MNSYDKCDIKQLVAGRERKFVVDQILQTEEAYVKDLEMIVNGYMASHIIGDPNKLIDRKKELIFRNIEMIYLWHRDYFLNALRDCQGSAVELGLLIKRSTRDFSMYYYYAGNQPLSELIINAHHSYFNSIREILGHHINLSGLTLKLVQRIALYEMWLKQLTEQSLSAGLIEEAAIVGEAYQQMNITVKKVQELLTVIPNLHGFNGDITDQGNLLLQGPLTCCIDVIQKHFELYVYLFQRIILFADIEKVKPPSIQTPKFNYRTHIHVHNMHLKELGENSFLLKSIVLNLPVLNIVCQAPTAESYSEWIRILNSVLVKPSKP